MSSVKITDVETDVITLMISSDNSTYIRIKDVELTVMDKSDHFQICSVADIRVNKPVSFFCSGKKVSSKDYCMNFIAIEEDGQIYKVGVNVVKDRCAKVEKKDE